MAGGGGGYSPTSDIAAISFPPIYLNYTHLQQIIFRIIDSFIYINAVNFLSTINATYAIFIT